LVEMTGKHPCNAPDAAAEIEEACARRVWRQPLEVGHEAADVDSTRRQELADVPVGHLAINRENGAEGVLPPQLFPRRAESLPVWHRIGESLTQVAPCGRCCGPSLDIP